MDAHTGRQTARRNNALLASSTHIFPDVVAACTAQAAAQCVGSEELQRVEEKMKGDTFHYTLAWSLPGVCECSEPAKAP